MFLPYFQEFLLDSNAARVRCVFKLVPGSTWNVPLSTNIKGGLCATKMKISNLLYDILPHIVEIQKMNVN